MIRLRKNTRGPRGEYIPENDTLSIEEYARVRADGEGTPEWRAWAERHSS